MNILVDNQLFMKGLLANSGHGRIWLNLFERLPSDVQVFTPARIRNMPKPLAIKLKGSPLSVIRPYRVGAKFLDWTCHVIDKLVPLDLLVPSLYVPQDATMALAKRIPMVTILDDLTPELVPGTMPEWLGPKRRCMEAATLIICISESTKNLAMDYYNLPASRFRVAPLACDLKPPDLTCPFSPLHPRPHFLVVGNRMGYKNFDLTLRSFAKIAQSLPDVDLVLAGPLLQDFEVKRIADLGLSDRVICSGRVDDDVLAQLYRGSLALIYPSFSEGFGIPPLEAMTCGTVPIVSDRTSMPEVVGDAGILVDPTSEEELIAAMLRMVQDESYRQQKILLGQQQAQKFSWDRTAELTFCAWKDAANS
jgi:glycosyltransferase involved in cell wall biosynthesis